MLKHHRKSALWLVGVLVCGLALQWWLLFWREIPLTKVQNLQIPAGSSVRKVLMDLYHQRLVQHPLLIEMWLRLLGKDSRWCAGTYQLVPGKNLWYLIQQLSRGEILSKSFVLLPGWNFKELLQHLAKADGLVHETATLTSAEIMARIGHAGEEPEGRFAPDTYRYAHESSDLALLARAYQLQATRLNELWSQRSSNDAHYRCPYEALIVASIIEKESQFSDEQELIAGIILQRLKLKMRLQLDPTVIYALGDQLKRKSLSYRDLKINSPYNTYRYYGLPPTPICQPSLKALKAAFHPRSSEYLYYVAQKGGKHKFSTNFAEHKVAKKSLNR